MQVVSINFKCAGAVVFHACVLVQIIIYTIKSEVTLSGPRSYSTISLIIYYEELYNSPCKVHVIFISVCLVIKLQLDE